MNTVGLFSSTWVRVGTVVIISGVTVLVYTHAPNQTGINYQPTKSTTPSEKLKSVTTTVFWVGETAGEENGFIANHASAWDEDWRQSYGDIDSETEREGYMPASFQPKENPFYFALPYNDIAPDGTRKPSASSCPNKSDLPHSWCKNSWIMIKAHGKVTYAQWEDVGPYEDDDATYVFGNKPPKNQIGAKAGLDVSPAVRDYLKLKDVDTTQWQFITYSQIPDGPWKRTITSSPGEIF